MSISTTYLQNLPLNSKHVSRQFHHRAERHREAEEQQRHRDTNTFPAASIFSNNSRCLGRVLDHCTAWYFYVVSPIRMNLLLTKLTCLVFDGEICARFESDSCCVVVNRLNRRFDADVHRVQLPLSQHLTRGGVESSRNCTACLLCYFKKCFYHRVG